MKINVWRHGAIVHDSVEGHETQIMELNKHDCGKDMGPRGTNYGDCSHGWPITRH